MNRLVYAAVIAGLAFAPLTASATPSPSPTLDTVLAQPPTGFTELTTSSLHGEFTAHDWATSNSSSTNGVSPAETEATLKSDGFVDGYGKTWVQAAQGHALIEAVMAFTGGNGARSALTSLEKSDKADPSFKHTNSISGIDPYYGVHFEDSSTSTVGDLFVFAKGNDIFLIVAASTKDDVLSLATDQAKSQYGSAPDSTIPSALWPENATPAASSGGAVLGFAILAIVLIVVAVAVVFVLRSRRRVPAAVPGYGAMTGYSMGPPPTSDPMVAAPMAPMAPTAATPMPAAAAPTPELQMSPDGYYWWDGQTWKDASLEAPPHAQRTPDGAQWWDGKSWRPVPH